jgi:MFS family permease
MVRRWYPIVALWLIGVLAAAQLAKVSSIAPLLRERFHLSLPETGLLISLLEVGGGTLGFVAGLTLGRIGCRRSLLAGMALLTAASLVEALAAAPQLWFAARAAEGIGYLLAVIAAPTAIAAIAAEGQRARALALWSCFVPIGVAIGGMLTATIVGVSGTAAALWLWTGLLAAATLAATRLPLLGATGRRIVLPALAAWISTFAFGIYTLFVCALTMLLPIFLVEQRGASVPAAGLIAGVASLSALPGTLFAIASLRGKRLSPRHLLVVAGPALLGTAMLSAMLFREGASALASGTMALFAIMLSGLVSPLVFARLPDQAGARLPHDPRIATANGLLTQFGAGGALIGPPLGGLIVRAWGWEVLGYAIGLMALAMLATTTLAEWAARASVRADAP